MSESPAEPRESAASNATEIIVCETCGANARDDLDRTQGEQLRDLLEAELGQTAGDPSAPVISSVRCLWACKRSCNVHIRAQGKFGYLLGEFEPSRETARALLHYSELYSASSDGSVPFRSWPDGVRGHFQCRLPAASPTKAAASGN